MRRFLVVMMTLLCVCLSLCAISCSNNSESDNPIRFDGPCSVMIDDNLLVCTFEKFNGDPSEIKITGKIDSEVHTSEMPAINGQSNFFDIGTEYGECDGEYYVFFEDSWRCLIDYDSFENGHYLKYGDSRSS